MIRNRFLFFLLLVFGFSACNKFDELNEISGVEYEAEYAIPLVDTKIAMKDVLEGLDDNSSMFIDEEGMIHFHYQGNVLSRTSDDIFETLQNDLPPFIPILDTLMALPFSSPDGIQIDYADIKTGSMEYTFDSWHEDDMTVIFSFPQVKDTEGDPLQQTHFLPYTGTLPTKLPLQFIDLEGYRLKPENDSLYIRYEAIHSDGQRDTVTNFLIIIRNLEFSFLAGYLGNQLYNGSRDTIEIDFFESWTEGNVYFEDPVVNINIFNSFGMPFRSDVKVFEVHTVQDDILPLESVYLDSGFDFAYPNFDEIGVNKTTVFTFNRDNSNIDVILGEGPVALDYDLDAFTNPDSDTDIRGYMTDSSSLTVQVEVELPLYGKATNFEARDTFELDLKQFEDATQAEIKLIAENNLPLGVEIQLYLADDNYLIRDSILTKRTKLAEAAQTNEEGYVTAPVKTVQYIPLDAAQLEAMRTSDHILMNASFTTSEEGNRSVRIMAEQEVQIKMGLKIAVSHE